MEKERQLFETSNSDMIGDSYSPESVIRFACFFRLGFRYTDNPEYSVRVKIRVRLLNSERGHSI